MCQHAYVLQKTDVDTAMLTALHEVLYSVLQYSYATQSCENVQQ